LAVIELQPPARSVPSIGHRPFERESRLDSASSAGQIEHQRLYQPDCPDLSRRILRGYLVEQLAQHLRALLPALQHEVMGREIGAEEDDDPANDLNYMATRL
jgi:hypothetical protein